MFLLGLTWDTSLLLSSASLQLGTALGHPWAFSLSGAEGGQGFARCVCVHGVLRAGAAACPRYTCVLVMGSKEAPVWCVKEGAYAPGCIYRATLSKMLVSQQCVLTAWGHSWGRSAVHMGRAVCTCACEGKR